MNITFLVFPTVILAGCLVLTGLGGCAVVDQNIELTYSGPDNSHIRHSGNISVTRVVPKPAAKNSSGKWIIGSINNANGVHQADLLSDRNPEVWISEALIHELRQAGFTVNYVETLPAFVAHGIAITDIHTFLVVNTGVVSTDTRHELKFNIDIFLNGNKAKTFTVAARDNRTVPLNASPEEKEGIVLQSLQSAMQQIIPEIIALIDKQ